MIPALLACLAFVHGIPARSPQATSDVSKVVKASVDAVVLITTNDASGKPIALGSGFLVSSDGRIVTNHHVISGAVSATVRLSNGAFFPVVGVVADDERHDVALIKVDGNDLPHLQLEDDPQAAALGQHVIAIGSSLGLENSVSDGIISGFRKDKNGVQWIQTTAPASHGNSGGPLLLLDGKVIGVVTWKLTEGENLNFAVPSTTVLPLLTSSAVEPLGAAKLTSEPAEKQEIWTSMTNGRDFIVRTNGDYIYTEWTNRPPELKNSSAFIRGELKKNGNEWSGTVRSFLPYVFKSSYMDFWKTGQRTGTENVKWCVQESEIEIERMSDSRIEGRSLIPTSFDAKKCKSGKMTWQPFVWIPK